MAKSNPSFGVGFGSRKVAKPPKKKPTRRKISNKAPHSRVPNIGNSNSAGMWGY